MKSKCIICEKEVKEKGNKYCSTECLWLNNLFNSRSKVRRQIKNYVKDDFEIIIKTKKVEYKIK